MKVYQETPYERFSGELLAVDSLNIILRPTKANPTSLDDLIIIPRQQVARFYLYLAQRSSTGVAILFELSTISHGFVLIFTLPINMIVAGILVSEANDSFVFSNSNITLDELKMYSRFPQGLPPQLKAKVYPGE